MLNTIIKLMQNNAFEYFFIAFDHKIKSFRHDMMDTYKQNRTKTPDELIKQMDDCIIALKAMGINVQSVPQYEADDLVGSFVKLMNDHDIQVDVYSSDKDLLQLVNKQTEVYLLKTGISKVEIYNQANFAEKFFGIQPKQVIDYKAIIGDNSDCLPGVKGIGPKTGIELIIKYHNLENIYQHLDELSPTLKNKFVDAKEIAYKCKTMATIMTNYFDQTNIDEFSIKQIDYDTINQITKKYHLVELEKYFNGDK